MSTGGRGSSRTRKRWRFDSRREADARSRIVIAGRARPGRTGRSAAPRLLEEHWNASRSHRSRQRHAHPRRRLQRQGEREGRGAVGGQGWTKTDNTEDERGARVVLHERVRLRFGGSERPIDLRPWLTIASAKHINKQDQLGHIDSGARLPMRYPRRPALQMRLRQPVEGRVFTSIIGATRWTQHRSGDPTTPSV